MPIYQYECELCHFDFERKQKFDDEPVAICPKCQGRARRTFNSVPIIFKGSGFYTTDNRKGSTNKHQKDKEESPDEQKQRGEVDGEGAATAG